MLPPGGLSLRHGFPDWFQSSPESPRVSKGVVGAIAEGVEEDRGSHHDARGSGAVNENAQVQQPPLTLEILQYIRIVFSTEALIDTVPLEASANPSAWHAWRSYRSRTAPLSTIPWGSAQDMTQPTKAMGSSTPSPRDLRSRSISPTTAQQQQQPGGARRPGEWNWQGVWEDRVKKSVSASISEHALFGGEGGDLIAFEKMDRAVIEEEILPRVVDE
jgi:hypothetical protein